MEEQTQIPDFANFDCKMDIDKTLIGNLDLGQDSGRVENMDENDESLFDSMVCDSSSRLIPNGFMKSDCKDEVILFVNAGGGLIAEPDSSLNFVADTHFEGGDIFETNECITEGGDVSFIYHTARLGDFQYRFDNLPEGNYCVDLHFVEIINTFGPKGMRVFNVYLQEEKANFDIFSVVGANKPLQLVDSRVSVKTGEAIVIRFEGVIGSPLVSGICIRKAPTLLDNDAKHDFLKCQNCAADIEVPSVQKKVMRKKSVEKYENRIQELTTQCQRKTDECYQAWMSLTAANEQLEKVRMELDNRLFQTSSLDQRMEKQSEQLRDISSRYEHDKKVWVAAVKELSQRITVLKQDHSKLARQAHQCADTVPDLNNMVSAVQALVAQCEDLKVKYNEEQAKRRKLHNQVEDAKGSIRVFCRCRPLSKSEASSGYSTVVDFDSAANGELGVLNSTSTKKTFRFDRVFTPNDNQVDVFAQASPLVTSVLDGYNVCIFAYGQTGTGKTFTMEGTEGNRGVNYRTLEELFKIAKERVDTYTYNISVSVLEVYNEQIRDLLATPSSSTKKLEVKQASEGLHNIPGLVEAKVENTKEVWNVLRAGSSARAVGSNNVNEHSSRSHCMLCIMVKAKNLINGECTYSKLWLVDLAGSERLAKTDAQGERLKEAQNINRSLSALGDVISALANKSSHIPYRNSKLTHLLQDSLGGESKTLMFVQISPSEHDLSETLSSLNFATRVRGVELGPARKQIDTSELQKMKMMLDKAKQESRLKDESLRKLEESLQNVEGKVKGKDQVHKHQQEKIKELEGQLEVKTGIHSQLEKQLSHLSEKLRAKEEVHSGLQQKVKELENKLLEREQSGAVTYQQKVKDLEDKLKLQVRESKSYTMTLQEKIEELERKLKEQEQNSDSTSLHLKIKELEGKLKDQERRLSITTIADSSSTMKPTPREADKHIGGSRDNKFLNEVEQHVLRSSNIMNRQTVASLNKSKRNDSLGSTGGGEVRRHRLSRNSEVENVENNNENKSRKSDGPRPVQRGAPRMVKPAPTQAAQRPVNLSRPSVAQGVKDRESKKRMWA
ncbi:di-glucose binding protein with Kinesin motor domain-containing protein [Artemisia annua]|uniref:Di-glucose binding protein with Kinesin motor domain-containing protein n=1 Tax=Artemisia annua TaxID=35608 RepID=A0A2U1P5R7_ARTAN|nr:di-glucose binding protein with Kinesin motor domain-containing protein [Artemisia annua]